VQTNVAELTKFLERKEVVFQKKMNDVNGARDHSTKMAHVRILQRCSTGLGSNAKTCIADFFAMRNESCIDNFLSNPAMWFQ
jgi:hypothetical protein